MDNPKALDRKVGFEEGRAFSQMLDGMEFRKMTMEQKTNFLKEIYLPRLKEANMTDEQIDCGGFGGRSVSGSS